MTCGRKRRADRKHAMPFHSVDTPEKAYRLIKKHCKRGMVGDQEEYIIPRTWNDGDILKAMTDASWRFGLEPVVTESST